MAAAGHTAIRAYSTGFRVVGCTDAVDAHDNTGTTGIGVPIYWLSGNKVADDYGDFYDANWDDEANDKNESGTDGPDTSQLLNRPLHRLRPRRHRTLHRISVPSTRQQQRSRRRTKRDQRRTPQNHHLLSVLRKRPLYGLSQVFQITPMSPSAPTNLTATAQGANQINLEWHAPTNNGGAAISGYKIQRSPNGNSGWTDLVNNTGNNDTEYSDTGLDPVTTRHYRVFAINPIGTSDASNVTNATTTVMPLDRVTDVNITPSDGALSVTWATVSDATGYKVEWKSGSQSYNSSRQALISSRTTTNYVISGLE